MGDNNLHGIMNEMFQFSSNLGSQEPGYTKPIHGRKRMSNRVGNDMDLIKKFRYNFHYWLKNCYSPEATSNAPSQQS